jgi:hypothetical protein
MEPWCGFGILVFLIANIVMFSIALAENATHTDLPAVYQALRIE